MKQINAPLFPFQAAADDDITKEELQRFMELAQYSLGTDELVSKGLNEAALEGISKLLYLCNRNIMYKIDSSCSHCQN